jgi:hypothetical protein
LQPRNNVKAAGPGEKKIAGASAREEGRPPRTERANLARLHLRLRLLGCILVHFGFYTTRVTTTERYSVFAQHSIWAVERVSVLQGGGAGSSPALPRTPVLFCTFLFGPKIEVFILHANAQNKVRRYDQSEVGVCRGSVHDGTWPGARPPPGNPTQKTQLRLSKTCLKVMSIWHLFLVLLLLL